MSTRRTRPKQLARLLLGLLSAVKLLELIRRGKGAVLSLSKCIANVWRKLDGWLKYNPVAVLLLFPLVATPASFAQSQRHGLLATLVATGALLWTAAGLWSSSMQELSALMFRKLEAAHAAQMNEVAKQQFELALATILGKPMTLAAAIFLALIACCRAAWYRGFMTVYYRSKPQPPMVGLHYFMTQSASHGLYLGIVAYATSFAINNWSWLEEPVYKAAMAGHLAVPALLAGLFQMRYFRHKAKVDRQLYGSWLAELVSTASSLIATVGLGCALMWLAGVLLQLSVGPAAP